MSESIKERWMVRYRYISPSGAGPFTGKVELTYKPQKGDEIHAVFGRAIVTSVRRIVAA